MSPDPTWDRPIKPEKEIDADKLEGLSGSYYLWRGSHKGTQSLSSIQGLESYISSVYDKFGNIDSSMDWIFTHPDTATVQYIDGSLAFRDASLNFLFDWQYEQDASSNFLFDWNTNQDASLENLYDIKADLTYVDASLAARDASIDEAVITARKRFDSLSEHTEDFTLTSGNENVLYFANHDTSIINVELPLHATNPIPVLSVFTVGQAGAQYFQFVGEADVSVRGGEKSWEQYTMLNAVKIAENEWWIIGGES